jgi:GT2 family glycosyltransferase
VLAVVVVIHDSRSHLERLLASLERHMGAVELVVADTGSRDGGADLARAHGATVVTLSREAGFGAANNAALELVRAPVTALLNPDVELLDDGLARLAADGRDALLVPRLLNADGTVQKSAHPRPGTAAALLPALLPAALPRFEPWRSEHERVVGWAIAAALVARTGTLRALGPFDPLAHLFYEDLDLCLHAAERGVPTILRPDVVLRHLGGHATGPAFGGEPHEEMALRRRAVVRARLGRRALALDDAAQGVTFAGRALAKSLLGWGATRERAQLRALRSARRR